MSTQAESSAGRRASYATGEESRTRIKQALVELKQQTGRWPTLDELGAKTGLSKTALRHHVRRLSDSHAVAISAPRREIVLLDDDAGAS